MIDDLEIETLLSELDNLDESELLEIVEAVEQIEKKKYVEEAYNNLLKFALHVMDDYKVGAHHKQLAKLLMEIESGEKDRICVNIAPRHGKSQLVSIFFIAWYIGRNPTHKIMLVSHTADLAVDFGRKVRNLVNTDQYREIFPNVNISADSKSAGRWTTNQGGDFYATGVGSALAGRGAHLLVIDDPHSEQDILNGNYEVFDKAYDWFTYGARTRLMKNGRVSIIQTRWHESDLTGRVVRDMIQNPKTDQYHVVEFPAILEVQDKNTGDIVEKALWPEMFDLEALHRIKAGMPLFQWNAQYQQNPTAEEAALIKREWWRKWKKENPPKCEYLIVTLDAAAETHNRADFTGITVWGVFNNEEESAYQIIALDSIKQRYEFPELKRKAIEVYEYWQPDSFIVEKKSAGAALYQEMRRMGIPVQEYTPHRGSGDKVARINSVADIVSSGMVWVPETRWAEELEDEVAAFPFGANDDLVDCTYMALSRFRQGGFIRLPSDMKDEQQYFKRRKAYY